MSDLATVGEPMGGRPAMTAEVAAQALGQDPTDAYARGTLMGLRMGYSAPGSSERAAFDALLDVPLRDRVIPEPHRNPLVTHPSPAEGRPLTVGDVAFLDGLAEDPSQVSPADAQLVAQLRSEVRAPSDKAVVDRVYGPLRTYHEGRERRARLEAQVLCNGLGGARGDTPTVREARERLVSSAAETMAARSAELTVDECRERVQAHIKERHTAENRQRAETRRVALEELREVCEESGLKSKVLADADRAVPIPPSVQTSC